MPRKKGPGGRGQWRPSTPRVAREGLGGSFCPVCRSQWPTHGPDWDGLVENNDRLVRQVVSVKSQLSRLIVAVEESPDRAREVASEIRTERLG